MSSQTKKIKYEGSVAANYSTINLPSALKDRTQLKQEPEILREEMKRTVRKLRNRKAPGPDGIIAEVLKTISELGSNVLYSICGRCGYLITGRSSGAFSGDSIFTPLFKKGSPLDCGNYRTLVLISHASSHAHNNQEDILASTNIR